MRKKYNTGLFSDTYVMELEDLKKIDFDDANILIEDDYIDECPYSNAYDFLFGSCELYAYVLNEKFNIEIYELRNIKNNMIHTYCKTIIGSNIIYIDVRGATTDKFKFFSLYNYQPNKFDEYKITPSEIDINDYWSKIGLEFAYMVFKKLKSNYSFMEDKYMNKFDLNKTKYIFNIGRGTLHYYNTQSCHSSKEFSPNDTNLKFYNTEDEAIRDNQTHLKKCKNCFKNK